MELWFTDHHGDTGFKIRLQEQLAHRKSPWQTIDIFETANVGRIMVIDGILMLTEWDEFVYHEMLTNIPAQIIPQLERVLIIGGGDGGTAREILKYPQVKEVILVDIDEEVIRAAKDFFPGFAPVFNDPRLKVQCQDGAQFVKKYEDYFDLVIIDSTDPIGPGEVLFTAEFYKDCARTLKSHGVLTAQSESPFDKRYQQTIRNIQTNLRQSFEGSTIYLGYIPTYPWGLWAFALAWKTPLDYRHPSGERQVPEGLKYYTRSLHSACFELPPFVQQLLP